jgi:membrane fusion protein, copper/silver efflux system
MKTKMILILATAALLCGGASWLVPHRLMAAGTVSDGRKILYYTCPMHPAVRSDKPGNCPECGMKLQAVYADATGTNAAPALRSRGGGCCGGN